MTPHIIFENDGLIDLRAIKTFGASVKESKSPIGYFGTGLKYAIGILLRERQEVKILVGHEEFNFSLSPVKIRGKNFSIITMNGEELGFTSEIGKNWELWMAYRELHCNTLDEGGRTYESHGVPQTKESKTQIIVTGEAFHTVYRARDEFILSSVPLHTSKTAEIHPKKGNGIFYRGIKVGTPPYNGRSTFTYNVLDNITLTEDRTSKWNFELMNSAVRGVCCCEDEEIIKSVLLSGRDNFERLLDFADPTARPSNTFMRVLGDLGKDYSNVLSEPAMALLRRSKGDLLPEPTSLNMVQRKQLEKAQDFCNFLGYNMKLYPVVVTESLGEDILGLAKEGRIFISLQAFEFGTKMVAATLLEEFIHLDTSYGDMTRSLQNLLFHKIVSLGEELRGEPL